jgi:hypothetical protein
MSQTSDPAPRDFDPRQLLKLYIDGEYDQVSEVFLDVFTHFQNYPRYLLDDCGQYYINVFVKSFLYLFTQIDYVVSPAYQARFVAHNLTIANLVSASGFQTTDAFLEIMRHQENNFVKILTLYSARNQVQFDRRKLFDLDPVLASVWYGVYAAVCQTGFLRPLIVDNLRAHFQFKHPQLDPRPGLSDIYYGSTYVDGACDRFIKPVCNAFIRETIGTRGRLITKPKPRKLAVLSAVWWPGHSVYRNYYAYLKHLDGYHLTLFELGHNEDVDVSLFDDVRRLDFDSRGVMDVAPIEGDYCAAYFPDIGMSTQSIWLANMRIAPVQLCSPGHSVSTWGADIDYFISGADVERPESPEGNYSERLVLLPGCGIIHNHPLHVPRGVVAGGQRDRTAEMILNCPASAQKINPVFVQVLRELFAQAQRPLRLRLLAGWSLSRESHYLPFLREITTLFGPDRIEVFPNLTYTAYMTLLEEGDFTIDAYHFGGCNSVADSLYLRRLMVTWEGDKWYNRIGSHMLRLVGLSELIATNAAQFVEVTLHLLHDESYRADLQERLDRADLDATIFSTADARCFQDALDFLIENHDRLQQDPDRSAIRIPRQLG